MTDRLPLAELELYGLPLRVINRLEACGAIYLDQLRYVTRKDFCEKQGFGNHELGLLKVAIDNFMADIQVMTPEEAVGMKQCPKQVKLESLRASRRLLDGQLPTTNE